MHADDRMIDVFEKSPSYELRMLVLNSSVPDSRRWNSRGEQRFDRLLELAPGTPARQLLVDHAVFAPTSRMAREFGVIGPGWIA